MLIVNKIYNIILIINKYNQLRLMLYLIRIVLQLICVVLYLMR